MTIIASGVVKTSSSQPVRVSISTTTPPPTSSLATSRHPPHRPYRRDGPRRNATDGTRRGRLHQCVTLGSIVAMLLIVDALAIQAVDEQRPGPFQQFTGLPPTFHLCILAVLHVATFFGAVSKTVYGGRLAMAIAWMFFLLCLGVLIMTPAFIGSYVSSGMATSYEGVFASHRSNAEPTGRFYNGFVSAMGGQFVMFLIWLGSVFQMTTVSDLLHEAHIIEDEQARREAEQQKLFEQFKKEQAEKEQQKKKKKEQEQEEQEEEQADKEPASEHEQQQLV